MDDLSHQAIQHALCGNWEKALETNLEILNSQQVSAETLNRLARAYAELGDLTKARESAKHVLEIDPFNTIAQKSLQKWSALKNGARSATQSLSAQIFLEEPGKTRVVPLVNLSSHSVILALECGHEVKLQTYPHSVVVATIDGKHVGRLTDDIANRLKKLIDAGNVYQCYIKCAQIGEVKVFLRELKRAEHIKHIPSFPTEKVNYVAFAAPELLRNKKTALPRSI
ncbi:MAG: Tetratricopeptide TPR_2 repeat protein [Candidatus Woesebacteria bacterium GW2011_GWB1_38_5b]|uniref:Tetratricopeptide TPR_2 repeat protein n=1 Tax=Candidatus Woesebacteria bacterium GW2011_GWB1_38_5b TaxID=1618569 RepID=A0A0G0K863_9BACT|nr:MAG: Tetratricopeptide TPR_2 repeat protein [Candidatus Woesebacteria bacterium GW2011_GWB1_38_5b]